MTRSGTLHAFCGKIASGKSSLATSIADAPQTILISEDALLSRLYPGEIATIDDYVRVATRLRAAFGPHLAALLRTGLNVVLDFQANTPAARPGSDQYSSRPARTMNCITSTFRTRSAGHAWRSETRLAPMNTRSARPTLNCLTVTLCPPHRLRASMSSFTPSYRKEPQPQLAAMSALGGKRTLAN